VHKVGNLKKVYTVMHGQKNIKLGVETYPRTRYQYYPYI